MLMYKVPPMLDLPTVYHDAEVYVLQCLLPSPIETLQPSAFVPVDVQVPFLQHTEKRTGRRPNNNTGIRRLEQPPSFYSVLRLAEIPTICKMKTERLARYESHLYREPVHPLRRIHSSNVSAAIDRGNDSPLVSR